MHESTLQSAVSGLESLPSLPSIVVRVLESVENEGTSALDLGHLIAADQSLAASLLRAANSAYFGFNRRVVDVPDAVAVLGFEEVRRIALAATTFRLFENRHSRYDRLELWRHSLASAMASERCARELGLLVSGGCYTVGLLHDIGKVAMDYLYPNLYMEALRESNTNGVCLTRVEKALFGCDHAEVGAQLVSAWHIPEPISHAIRFHHSAGDSQGQSNLPDIAAVGSGIAVEAGFSHEGSAHRSAFPEASFSRLGLTASFRDGLTQKIADSRAVVDELLSAFETTP